MKGGGLIGVGVLNKGRGSQDCRLGSLAGDGLGNFTDPEPKLR